MNFRALVIGLGVGLLISTANAVDLQYVATTVGGTARQGTVVASGIRWQCDTKGCTTTGPWPVPGVGACKSLAQQIGPIRSYGHSKIQLTPAQLEQCNAGLPAATAMTAKQSMKVTPAPRPVPPPAPTSTPTGKPSTTPSKPGAFTQPMLNNAQLRQTVQLRTNNYDALARTRNQAIAEARRRAEEEKRQRIAAHTHGGDDCDDSRMDVHPGLAETCDGRDNDCNGMVDEGQLVRRYLDADGDGHGDPARGMDVCIADTTAYARSAETSGGPWLVELGNDCDDHNPDVWHDCH